MARRFLRSAVFVAALSAAWPAFAQNPVTVIKTGAPGGPVAGSNYSYTVTVRNSDPANAAANVVLTDDVPVNTTFVAAVQNSGPAFACTTPAVGATVGTISCSIPALPVGSADAVFTFTFHIPATLQPPTPVRNTANVSTTSTDTNLVDNSSTFQLGVVTSADLGVVKTGPATYVLGTNYTYTITVNNAGPSDSQSVHMLDNLTFAPFVAFVSITQTSGVPFTCTTPAVGSTGLIDCSTATLPAGSSAVFQLVVKSHPQAPLPVNQATVNSTFTTPDPSPPNNTSTFFPMTNTSDADLQVTKSGPLTAVAGQTVTYTISATNNGPSYANGGPRLVDTLPAGSLTFESWTQTGPGAPWACVLPPVGSSGTITCVPPDGNPGTAATFSLVARVASSVANGGSVTNTATYTEPITPDSVSSNNSASVTTGVTRLADLSVSKVAGAGTVNPGGNITYTVVVSNSGASDAANVVLDDVVPTGTTFVSATQTSGPAPFPCSNVSGTIHCTTASMASGTTAQFTFVVQNNTSNLGGTVISNTATASTSTPETTLANNSASATVTVTAAGLAITKSASPNPVGAGNNITYTVTVSNVGTIGAHDATMADSVPANTTFVSNTQTSGPTFTCTNPAVGGTGPINCTNALLAAGASATFSIVVRVNPTTASGTTISNTATTSTSDTDPNLSNNTATANTSVTVGADVRVTKSAPATVAPGANLTYTVTISNSGTSDAQTVSLTDTIPVGTTFTSETQTSGPAFSCSTPAVGGTGTITCNIATLGAGATATFSFVVNVNAGIGTTISNTASATSTSADSNTSNNSSTATTTVAGPDLSVTKSDGPDPVVAGSNITYTIVVMNNGTAGANNVSLSDTTPANTTFVSTSQTAGTPFSCSSPGAGTSGTITCTAALLGPASSATFQIVVQVTPGTAASTIITNTATATTTDTETNLANNSSTTTTTVSATPLADVSVTKSDTPDPVAAGGQITYTINVTNIGGASAANVTLTDVVPTNTTFFSVTSSQGSCSGTATVTCNLGTLISAGSATVTLVVTVGGAVPGGTIISNTASVTTTTSESSTANNSATTTTTVSAPTTFADISITKSASPNPVAAGGDLFYTITVNNIGTAAATNVSLTDILPASTTFRLVTVPAGWGATPPPIGSTGTLTANTASLAAGASATFILQVAVGAATPGGTIISNTASATTSSAENSTANNSATATTTVNAAPSTTDVSLTKSANASTVAPGGQITYTLTATNTGSIAATNVSVSDTIPTGTTFVSATPSQGTCSGTATVSCALGTIAAGASATVTLIITAPSTNTTVSNTATLTSSNDSNAANNSASANVSVLANIPLFSPLLLALLALAFVAIALRLLTE